MKSLSIDSMDLHLDLGAKIISVIGPNNSGKSYMLKKLINIIDNNDVFIDNQCIKRYSVNYLKRAICVVLDNYNFETDNVYSELRYYLELLNVEEVEINKRIDQIANVFKIENILNKSIHELNINNQVLIKILSLIIIKPKLLGLDNLLVYLSIVDRNRLLKFIKTNEIILIYTTTDSNELKYSNKVIVLNELKCVHTDTPDNIVQGNSILPYLGIKLPFTSELSQNLMLYDLIDEVILDERKLVDNIWK